MYVIMIAVLSVFFGSVGILMAKLLCSRQRARELQRQIDQYRIVHQELGFYFLRYDIAADVVTLSPQCAECFQLPERIDNYFKRSLKEAQAPEQPLYLVAQSLRSPCGKHFYKYRDTEGKLKRFQLFTKIFEDAEQRPEFVFGIFIDVTKKFQTETRLEAKARMDGLTRINNSGATRSYLRQNVGTTENAVLLLVDVDNFKSVNDTLGHQKGDMALLLVANVLKQAAKGEGFIGRLGGDEFCCYFSDVLDPGKIEAMCAFIKDEVREQSREQELGAELTLSIGGAAASRGDTYDQVYALADKALYQAKEKGRNTFVLLKPER